MLIGCMGDLHLRMSVPTNRKDDYPEALFKKFEFVLKTCDNLGIKYLIQPGDFFESANEPIELLIRTIGLLRKYKVHVIVVYGQHDMHFHSSNTQDTPLCLLENLGLVTRAVRPMPIQLNKKGKKICVWGASWGEELPDDDLLDKKKINILATHRLVIDEKPWPGVKNYSIASHLLRKTSFDLFVCGDNHSTLFSKYGDKYLINCGSLGRTNINQVNHIPMFVVFDTATRKLRKVPAPIGDPNDVFKLKEAQDKKEKDGQLQAKAQKLVDQYVCSMEDLSAEKKANFKNIVLEQMKKNKNDDLVPEMNHIFKEAANRCKK